MTQSMEKLLEIIKTLRDPVKGCPWDLSQTQESLIEYLEEECYELIAALRSKNTKNIIEELGDVLMQVLLHSQIASENNSFTFEDVVATLSEKLVYRHPHVFGNEQGVIERQKNPQDAKAKWDEQKIKEKLSLSNDSDQKEEEIHLKEELLQLAPMNCAYKLGEKAKKYHFDWNEVQQVAYKVEEEWQEVKELLPNLSSQGNLFPQTKENLTLELGDLFFTIIQLCRHLEIMPQKALYQGNLKFFQRFQKMIQYAKRDQRIFSELRPEELERYWNEAKTKTSISPSIPH